MPFRVNGHDARRILPSDDEPQATGQKHMAEVVVQLPYPVEVRGQTYTDGYLVLIADTDHIEAIARTMLFETP